MCAEKWYTTWASLAATILRFMRGPSAVVSSFFWLRVATRPILYLGSPATRLTASTKWAPSYPSSMYLKKLNKFVIVFHFPARNFHFFKPLMYLIGVNYLGSQRSVYMRQFVAVHYRMYPHGAHLALLSWTVVWYQFWSRIHMSWYIRNCLANHYICNFLKTCVANNVLLQLIWGAIEYLRSQWILE